MPDGKVVAFPDDMPKEQVKSLILQKYPDAERQYGIVEAHKKIGGSIPNPRGAIPWSDEIISGMAVPLNMARRAWNGQDEGAGLLDRVGNAYNEEVGIQRGIRAADQEKFGGWQTAADIVGGLGIAAPARAVGAVGQAVNAARVPAANSFAPEATAEAANLAARIKSGSAWGGGLGALYGSGEGEDLESRLEGGLYGGAGGAIVGGAVPAVSQGIGAGAARTRDVVGNLLDSEGRARRVVSRAMRDDIAGPQQMPGQRGLNDQEMIDAEAMGYPVRNVDRGGENVTSLGDAAFQRSLGARALMEPEIQMRNHSQLPQTEALIGSMRNAPDEVMRRRAALAAGRDRVRGMYERAYSMPRASHIWNDRLSALGGSDIMQEAMKRANRIGTDEAAMSGRGRFANPFEFQEMPDGSTRLLPVRRMIGLDYWDTVKKGLDEVINAEDIPIKGMTDRGRRAVRMKNELLDILDSATIDPKTGASAYRTAREQARQYLGADSAAEAGADVYKGAKGATDKLDAIMFRIRRWTPEEREEAAQGYLAAVMDDMTNKARSITGDSGHVDLSLNLLKTEKERRVARELLGPERYAQLEMHKMFMRTMAYRNKRFTGGSPTVKRALQDVAVGGGLGGGAGLLTGMLTGNSPSDALVVGAGLGAGARGAGALVRAISRARNDALAPEIAEILMDTDPRAYQEAVRAVASDRALRDRARILLHPLRMGVAQNAGKE